MDEPIQKFNNAGQSHIFDWRQDLGDRAQRRLARQLSAIDVAQFPHMLEAIESLKTPIQRNLSPAPSFELSNEDFPYALSVEAQAMKPRGEKELREGKVAVVLVAGGQGTRLGFDGPKGCFETLPLSGMTLFEIFARKLRRVGNQYGITPSLYVMVGNHNEAPTREFWQDHEFFGLAEQDVKFFAQGELPAFDNDGKLLLADKDRLFTAPDGHGGVLEALHVKGMIADMTRRGVTTISYLQVDNLQAPVADADFIGLHLSEGADVSLKVVRKQNPGERVGIYCFDDGVPGIVEYSEFSDEQARQQDDDGRLKYWQGSIAVHAFRLDFLKGLIERGVKLPLHAARKKVPHIDAQGKPITPDIPNAWKFERFIFDVIPLASNVVCLEVPREEQFLPLKNADGPFGPEGVRQSYQTYWGKAVEKACNVRTGAIEIDPLRCENARDLIQQLKENPVQLDADEPFHFR